MPNGSTTRSQSCGIFLDPLPNGRRGSEALNRRLITDAHPASLSLPLPTGDRRKLRLYAIVTRALPHPARYQITERPADRVIGGATLQLGL